MSSYDVVVVGGGIGGCVAAAMLSKIGKKTLLIERGSVPGGRIQSIDYQGYTLDLGAHLIEDTGSGLCRIFEFLGESIEIGGISDSLPVWVDDGWKHIGEILKAQKPALKPIISAIVNTDYSEFENFDHIPLRTWLQSKGADQATIEYFEFLAALEQITGPWYDHSASENLFVRKMHYEEKNMAGYSFWPKGGYRPLFDKLTGAIERNGGEVLTSTEVTQVLIEKGQVKGVIAVGREMALPNEYKYGEVIEAPCVIATLPVWSVLGILPGGVLPPWYEAQIRMTSLEAHKACWLGMYAGSEAPVFAKTEKELCAWDRTPRVACPGFAFSVSRYDPSVAPAGKHLFVCGFSCRAEQIADKDWVRRTFQDIEMDLEQMYPSFKQTDWRIKHIVYNPPFGVQGKTGVVGRFRPDFIAPNVDGLFFASDTFRGRGVGIDKASRTALSCVERINGEKIPFFEKTWRY